jgi:hypothetical protein
MTGNTLANLLQCTLVLVEFGLFILFTPLAATCVMLGIAVLVAAAYFHGFDDDGRTSIKDE